MALTVAETLLKHVTPPRDVVFTTVYDAAGPTLGVEARASGGPGARGGARRWEPPPRAPTSR